MKEMKANIGNDGARRKLNGMGRPVVARHFADDTVSFAENEGE